MYLGASHAIRFRFDGGLLTGILLDPHRKPPLEIREELVASGVSVAPLVASAAPELARRQELGTGHRALDVEPDKQSGTSAVLRMRFALDVPTDWLLSMDGDWQRTEQGAAVSLPDRTRLAVTTTAACVIHGAGLRVTLPAGHCEVALTVTSEPVFPVGDTVVVCRPDQVREAAIVASCLPADRFTPIIAVEPPPAPRARHLEIYRAYKQQLDRTQSSIGTRLGMTEALKAGGTVTAEILAGINRQQALRAQLTPYRSWAKHNLMVSKLVSRMGIERAVFLHDFTPEELESHDPGLNEAYNRYAAANDRDPGEIGHMFDNLPTKVRLVGVPVPDLTVAAWRLLREPDGEPERVVEVALEGPSSWVAGLFTALRLGAALRAVDQPSKPSNELFALVNPDGPEAVLVEDTGSATTLLGALYAHHRAARLVVTPPPDLDPVQRAVAAHQARITTAARAVDEARGISFVDAVRQYLAGGGRNPYATIEEAVTAQVPAGAIEAVGDRRLTAFTTGLPYSFVRDTTADWSGKPIGHVAADAALILLSEFYAAGMTRPAGAFSLVFDPGFFRVSETPDVLRSVGAHFTHPLLLSNKTASMEALRALPNALPVELIFFNTHGADDGIVMSDMIVDRDILLQLVEFDQRPIVFNNSCQSWTGVGREFVRVGARGYIGTLWSIPSRQAADFARIVMDRLTADALPVTDAIVGTGLAGDIERAYLYVGTASGRLDQWPDRVTSGESLLAHCELLVGAARRETDLADVLRREITALRRAAEGTEQARTVTYVDTMLDELSLYSQRKRPSVDDARAAEQLMAEIDNALRGLDLPAEVADRRWAFRFECAGYLRYRSGEPAAALADFERSIGYGDACRNRADLLLSAAQIRIRQAQWAEAARLVGLARDVFTEQHNRPGALRAIGMLGQLSKRLGRYEEAMTHAREGYELAVKLEDRSEQATFLLDLSTLYQLGGDLDTAITAATRALETFRIIGDDGGELNAIGRLSTCHRDKDELDAAMAYARTGLEQAGKLGNPVAVAEFQNDIGQVLTRQHRHAEALAHHQKSVSTLIENGAWELAAGMLGHLAPSAIEVGDADALWTTAIWSGTICDRIEQHLWTMAVPTIVDVYKAMFVVSPPNVLVSQLPALLQALRADDGPKQSIQLRLLHEVVAVLWLWRSSGNQRGTVSHAEDLDSRTGGTLKLAEFVAVPHAQRTR